MTFKSRKHAKTLVGAVAGLGFLATAFAAGDAAAQAKKITIALPGVPPIFGSVFTYVAQEAGIYKKYGLDVTLKPFNSGVGAARAVVSGNIDVSMSPTPPVAVMVSNAGVPLVMVHGIEINDWMLGSMDPSITTCAQVKGVPVGVDSPRGARWIQLANMVRPCKLVPDKTVPTVNLSSNVGAAMVSGKLKLGVLHSDDIPVIERESGKKLTIVARVNETSPGSHYAVFVSNKKYIASNRDTLVRMAAAHLEAQNMLYDQSKWPQIAKWAAPTGRNAGDSIKALKIFTDLKFWPRNHAGLSKKRIGKAVAIQTGVGKRTKGKAGINPKKKPATHAQLTDMSIVADALKMMKKMN
ncbi:MAG: ABC transporter substrate-binding protein [Rhodospirillaceae bacterium]|jgi:ABC-type nitrate/sulfonate/bicarbonate transport system substrate-binding protein|nr:ABC transporter substrate-binding protein [Rhodospirillaceae bacterium]MBT4751198.1 ABC transporter substrate-binding protein [Rhodospirillaceae bacterium]MBT6861566.1 ABC transporter substrate-binding protein [Rhodospirillaceae bacterium]